VKEEIIQLTEDVSSSSLYSDDLAPVTKENRSWSVWSLAALWVGMAVCIPTFLLASYFTQQGMSWIWALIIIGIANLIITIPMVLSGHAGVKYGVSFPVVGRAVFGVKGVHIPAILRGLIAAAWFGIQTWIGGIAVYSIYCAFTGTNAEPLGVLSFGKFVGFFIFWCINIFFIWKGTESIKWLETYAAPLLLIMGIALIIWGSINSGSFKTVLDNSYQMENPTATIVQLNSKRDIKLTITPLTGTDGVLKADQYTYKLPNSKRVRPWINFTQNRPANIVISDKENNLTDILSGKDSIFIKVRKSIINKKKLKNPFTSKSIKATVISSKKKGFFEGIWPYMIMLTGMVGFWATMSISIADITRYAKSQKDQVKGQFIGLPGTMILFSFIAIFATVASGLIFPDVLIREQAPWNPSNLVDKFDGTFLKVFSQFMLIIATLSTNIAANVIAPANAFANAFPKKITFRSGGIITGFIGIILCPWWLMSDITTLLLFVSSLLGPVVAIMICDYFLIRKTKLNLNDMFKTEGQYSYGGSGFNKTAMIAFGIGAFIAGIGKFVSELRFLFDIAWFVGFFVAFVLYYVLIKMDIKSGKVKV